MTDLSLRMPPIRTQRFYTLFRVIFPRWTSNPPTSTVQFIIDALANYAKEIGTHLSKNTFAACSNGQTRWNPSSNHSRDGRKFSMGLRLPSRYSLKKEYRDGNWLLINCLSSALKVHHAFTDILGEEASLIPFPLPTVLLTKINVLSSESLRYVIRICGYTLEPRSDGADQPLVLARLRADQSRPYPIRPSQSPFPFLFLPPLTFGQ